MTGVIVVLPKIDDAKKMKNLLVRNGISVAGACTTGAQAIALADNLNDEKSSTPNMPYPPSASVTFLAISCAL